MDYEQTDGSMHRGLATYLIQIHGHRVFMYCQGCSKVDETHRITDSCASKTLSERASSFAAVHTIRTNLSSAHNVLKADFLEGVISQITISSAVCYGRLGARASRNWV